MSCLSMLPYSDVLKYWEDRIERKYKLPFILTKILEVYSFNRKKEKPKKITNSKAEIVEGFYESNLNENPLVAVIIPAYIKTDFDYNCLKRLVSKLRSQTYKIDNIIIVDDCSPYQYKLEDDLVFYKFNKNQGPANARNKGLEIALKNNADIIVFTDVDCIPEDNWVEKFINAFKKDSKAHILSGKTKSYNKTWLGKYHEINGTLNGRRFKDSDLLLYGPTCNLAIIQEAARSIRFNTEFPNAAGEDIDFCFSAIQQGFNIKYCDEAIINHDFGYKKLTFFKNIKSFMNQFGKYAKGEKILIDQIPEYYSYLNKTEEISATR
ncbi:glycosyltransferase family 2 protein [Natronospora cellulosivora (SeqCode)]